ncbi:acetoacetate--CoA ligase [Mycolicibacterium sp.]|uniref:acetoacetate--CoA ligase n=1 Tax=Mycolicibacterium sp. TaxID=2320850 RepID=UPI003D0E72A2
MAVTPHAPAPSAPRELWRPSAQSIAASRMGRYVAALGEERGRVFSDYHQLWQWSVTDLDGFWSSVYRHFDIAGHGDTSRVLADATMPGSRWFPDVELNYAENMLRGADSQPVVVALSQTRAPIRMTRGELRDAVARAATGLRGLGVGKGDRVVGYLPNIPEALIAMLATTSIGAIWAVCAPELGTAAVLDRLVQLEPKVLLAVDGYRYGTKDVDRRSAVADIADRLPSLRAVVQVPYLHPSPAEPGTWADLISEPAQPSYERVPFDHPLWVLFSSGTTGLPKAMVHSHGGIILEHVKAIGLHLDTGPGDVLFAYCTTTWMVWNFLVSGLLVGATVVLMDGSPAHPGQDELWRVVEQSGVSVFICGAAYLAGCQKSEMRPGEQFDLTALRVIAATGSPLPATTYDWIYDAVKPAVLLQSSSGGTDVASSFVGGNPMLPVWAGEISGPMLGVHAAAYGPDGTPVIDALGELVITAPMPSMPVRFWNDPEGATYRKAYFEKFPGVWCHGDWVRFTGRGSCVITGRSDGTLNRGGVRLGTSEFYAVLEALPEIDDSLVVHIEDAAGGLGTLYLFVQLAAGSLDDRLHGQIAGALREQLSPRHVPDQIVAVPAIPYNLTGKKLEVPVKRLLQGTARGTAVSDGAVRNPESLDVFEQLAQRPVGTTSTAGA